MRSLILRHRPRWRLALTLAAFGLLGAPLGAQISPGHWMHELHGEGHKGEDPPASRRLTGTVFDAQGRAVPGAIVYLENKHNMALYTYIAGGDGSYRFNNLSPDVDYEVHAEANGRKSGAKTLSSFDSRKRARINLKLKK